MRASVSEISSGNLSTITQHQNRNEYKQKSGKTISTSIQLKIYEYVR